MCNEEAKEYVNGDQKVFNNEKRVYINGLWLKVEPVIGQDPYSEDVLRNLPVNKFIELADTIDAIKEDID